MSLSPALSYGGFLGRGPVFGRPLFRPMPRQNIRSFQSERFVGQGPQFVGQPRFVDPSVNQQRFVDQSVNRPGRSCNGFSCGGGSSNFSNGAFFEDDFRNIDGTRTLTVNGGALFERNILTGEPVAELQIDPFTGVLTRQNVVRFNVENRRFNKGDLFFRSGHFSQQGISGALIRDLVEFYDRNLSQFRTNLAEALLDEQVNGIAPGTSQAFLDAQLQLFQVENFLRFYGNMPEVPPGTINVDLKNTTFPEDLAKWAGGEENAKLATLSYLFNTISPRNPDFFNPGAYAPNKSLDLSQFIDQFGLNRLMHNDPYNCGIPGKPMRLDYLVARAMDPDIYYEMMGFADNFDIFAREFGVDPRPDRISRRGVQAINRGDAHPDKAVILHDYRIRGWEFDQKGAIREGQLVPGVFYRSYDNDITKTGQSINFATNPHTTTQENFSFGAGEIIGRNPNGFMNFYLHSAAGDRAKDAPGIFADGRNAYGGRAVVVGVSCLECHAGGQIGFNTKRDTPYDEGLAPNQLQVDNRVREDNSEFVDKLQAAGAYIPVKEDGELKKHTGLRAGDDRAEPAAVLPKVVRGYYEDLSLAQVSKELFGFEYEGAQLQEAINNIRQVASLQIKRREVASGENGETSIEETISRRDFEAFYCSWKYGHPVGGQQYVSTHPHQQHPQRLQGHPHAQPHHGQVPFNVHGPQF